MQSAKLFIKSLNFATTAEGLTNYFSKFGPVAQANVVNDRLTGRSRGFGFVTFNDPEAVQRSLQATSHEIDGRSVIVTEAIEMDRSSTNRPRSYGTFQHRGGYGMGGGQDGQGHFSGGYRNQYNNNNNSNNRRDGSTGEEF